MTWNVGEYIKAQLVDRFGFEAVEEQAGADRRVDSQHVVRANISPFSHGAGGSRAGIEFALGRRDINELEPVFGSVIDSWHATVLEIGGDYRFLGRPDGHWLASEASTDDVDAFLDEWVPQLDGIANLPFIEQYIATDDRDWDDATRDRVKQLFWSTAVANRMLSGWSVEDDEHLLQYRVDSVAHFDEDSRMRVLTEGQVGAIRAWIAEHPNGVERELTD